MTEHEAYIAFNLTERMGSVRVARAAAEAGGVVPAWEACARELTSEGKRVDWEGEIAKAARHDVHILTPADDDYPADLLDQASHPLALYVRGHVEALKRPGVALVGTRRPTLYGLDQCRAMAEGLAREGWAVISGLALGIDAAAHEGALAVNGTTIGIIGSALDRFYPKENTDLAKRIIAAGGAVVSEFPFGREPDARTFPQRNHVVAALAKGVVAIEAPLKSGTLITTKLALDLGRIVMALPGRVDARASAGCLALLREGARLVRHATDVMEELREFAPLPLEMGVASGSSATPQSATSVPLKSTVALTPEESLILDAVTEEGVEIDELVRRTGLPVARVNIICMTLRLKGCLRYFAGNRVFPANSEN